MSNNSDSVSFAAAKNREQTNWIQALNTPSHDRDTWRKLRAMAGDWVTCACGNQCSVIERYPEHGEPVDRELRKLGWVFFVAVQDIYNTFYESLYSAVDFDGKVDVAKAILNQIEMRSAELIDEYWASQNNTNNEQR